METMLIREELYCRHCKRFLQVNTEIKKCAFCGAELLVSRDYYLGNGIIESALNFSRRKKLKSPEMITDRAEIMLYRTWQFDAI